MPEVLIVVAPVTLVGPATVAPAFAVNNPALTVKPLLAVNKPLTFSTPVTAVPVVAST